MNTDERITTLALFGCRFLRRPEAGGNDPLWRAVTRGRDIPAYALIFKQWNDRSRSRSAYRWHVMTVDNPAGQIEIAWEPDYIRRLSAPMFEKFLRGLADGY